MEKLKRIIFLNILLFIAANSSFASDNINHKLRRYKDDFYENSYKGTLKQNIENSNKVENDIKSVKQKPQKKSNYKGHYKVGKPYTVMGQTYYPREQPNYKEVGMASWYGDEFHNRRTANGETFDMNDYTAGHRTLPMPCIVRVTNLENGKSIKVRINDRGPFVKNRIIDVSKKTAKALGFKEKGTTKVRVEYLKKESEDLLVEYGLK